MSPERRQAPPGGAGPEALREEAREAAQGDAALREASGASVQDAASRDPADDAAGRRSGPPSESELSGLVLVDKPAGITSHDLVDVVRRAAGQRSVGHIGTLDPMATGLMGLLLGPATKLGPWLSGLDKRYRARFELGLATDTDDVTGKELRRVDGPWPDLETVWSALSRFLGRSMQIPPAYSAVKVGGVAAHRAARAGRPVDLAPREVEASLLRVVDWKPPFLDLIALVSSGFYVRALARDLGARLGLGGAMSALRRETVGRFSLSDAIAPPASRGDLVRALIEPRQALAHLPELTLCRRDLTRLERGSTIPSGLAPGGPYRVTGPDGRLAAVAEVSPPPPQKGRGAPRQPFLRPLRVLRA